MGVSRNRYWLELSGLTWRKVAEGHWFARWNQERRGTEGKIRASVRIDLDGWLCSVFPGDEPVSDSPTVVGHFATGEEARAAADEAWASLATTGQEDDPMHRGQGELSDEEMAGLQQACLRIGAAMVGRYGAYHGGRVPLHGLEIDVLKWIDEKALIDRIVGDPHVAPVPGPVQPGRGRNTNPR